MPVFSFGKPQIIQRGFVKGHGPEGIFRKELLKEGNEESKEKVFVTAHGTVYHKSTEVYPPAAVCGADNGYTGRSQKKSLWSEILCLFML